MINDFNPQTIEIGLNRYKGIIFRYSKDRKFGFIRTDENLEYFFQFDDFLKKELKQLNGISCLNLYDEIEFSVAQSLKDKLLPEAINLKYLGNSLRQQMINEFNQQGFLIGYLKFVNNTYFIKHKNTHVTIPIEISEWEIDIEDIYQNRINQLVTYEINQTSNLSKLKGSLIDRKYSYDYRLLLKFQKEQTPVTARLGQKQNKGFIASIFDDTLIGYISINQSDDIIFNNKIKLLRNGMELEVKITNIYSQKRVSMRLFDYVF